jgi:glucan phosphorylase
MLARAYELSQVPLMLRYARQKLNLLDVIRLSLTLREREGLTALFAGVLKSKSDEGVAKRYFAGR